MHIALARFSFLSSSFLLCWSLSAYADGSGAPLAPVAQRAFDAAALRRAKVDPKALRCNGENRWGASLRPESKEGALELYAAIPLPKLTEDAQQALKKKLQNILFWRMVRAVLIEGNNNNLGAMPLRGYSYTDASGKTRPVILFRSGLTPRPDQPDSCFASLLSAGGVRHVVNLFDGDIPVADLNAAETQAAQNAGATYHTASDEPSGYGPWRELLRSHYDEPEKRAEAMASVARLVREQILQPQGAQARGNIHIHCGGGMHRSGMVFGIIERCINQTPLPIVESHYRYHVGYQNAQHPGGLEEGNLRFIRDFDCGLLRSPKP